MNDHIAIDLDDEGHYVAPPTIDFLYFEPELEAYVAEFVPDPQISSERTEAVCIPRSDVDGSRIEEFLQELGHLLGSSRPVVRVFHKGAGNFGFYLRDGSLLELQESLNPGATQKIHDVLQMMSNFVQLAFLRENKIGSHLTE